ncbi:MAG: GTP cyclohydrolase II [Saprospiraceae bacterium]|nr:GTP cyclohydrolase II [Saprospiraceae bacterium]
MPKRNSEKSPLVRLPTDYGDFEIQTITSKFDQFPHVILQSKKPLSEVPILRIHSECFTGDVLGSKRCDCAYQLHKSLERINKDGGILIYLRQEGRGIGLHSKIEAYALQDQGLDTMEANKALGFEYDEREYSIALSILKEKNINQVRLITNNPGKINFLIDNGVEVKEIISLIKPTDQYNLKYLKTKRDKMGHKLPKEI